MPQNSQVTDLGGGGERAALAAATTAAAWREALRLFSSTMNASLSVLKSNWGSKEMEETKTPEYNLEVFADASFAENLLERFHVGFVELEFVDEGNGVGAVGVSLGLGLESVDGHESDTARAFFEHDFE